MSNLSQRLSDILRTAPGLMRVLGVARDLDLPDWLVFSGAVYQPVWNHLTGRPIEYGVKDYDLAYFDSADISWEAEDLVIRRVAAAFEPPLRDQVEARNQARVHLWFEGKFGEAYPPLGETAEALTRFTALRLRGRRPPGCRRPLGRHRPLRPGRPLRHAPAPQSPAPLRRPRAHHRQRPGAMARSRGGRVGDTGLSRVKPASQTVRSSHRAPMDDRRLRHRPFPGQSRLRGRTVRGVARRRLDAGPGGREQPGRDGVSAEDRRSGPLRPALVHASR